MVDLVRISRDLAPPQISRYGEAYTALYHPGTKSAQEALTSELLDPSVVPSEYIGNDRLDRTEEICFRLLQVRGGDCAK